MSKKCQKNVKKMLKLFSKFSIFVFQKNPPRPLLDPHADQRSPGACGIDPVGGTPVTSQQAGEPVPDVQAISPAACRDAQRNLTIVQEAGSPVADEYYSSVLVVCTPPQFTGTPSPRIYKIIQKQKMGLGKWNRIGSPQNLTGYG